MCGPWSIITQKFLMSPPRTTRGKLSSHHLKKSPSHWQLRALGAAQMCSFWEHHLLSLSSHQIKLQTMSSWSFCKMHSYFELSLLHSLSPPSSLSLGQSCPRHFLFLLFPHFQCHHRQLLWLKAALNFKMSRKGVRRRGAQQWPYCGPPSWLAGAGCTNCET